MFRQPKGTKVDLKGMLHYWFLVPLVAHTWNLWSDKRAMRARDYMLSHTRRNKYKLDAITWVHNLILWSPNRYPNLNEVYNRSLRSNDKKIFAGASCYYELFGINKLGDRKRNGNKDVICLSLNQVLDILDLVEERIGRNKKMLDKGVPFNVFMEAHKIHLVEHKASQQVQGGVWVTKMISEVKQDHGGLDKQWKGNNKKRAVVRATKESKSDALHRDLMPYMMVPPEGCGETEPIMGCFYDDVMAVATGVGLPMATRHFNKLGLPMDIIYNDTFKGMLPEFGVTSSELTLEKIKANGWVKEKIIQLSPFIEWQK